MLSDRGRNPACRPPPSRRQPGCSSGVRRQPAAAAAVRRIRPESGAHRAAARRLAGVPRQSAGDLRPAELRGDRARDPDGALSAAEARPESVDRADVDAALRFARTPGERNLFDRIERRRHGGAHPAPPDQRRARPMQAAYLRALRESDMVFALGPAGTGKTYLAVAVAVAMLNEGHGRSHRAVASGGRGRRAARLPARRPAREDRSLSAAALRRALRHAAGRAGDEAPDEQARSRSRRSPSCAAARLSNSFVIVDEAQNTTPVQMKMLLTRLGEDSRMVVTGDLEPDRPARRRALGAARCGRRADARRGHQLRSLHRRRRRAPRAGEPDRARL